MSVAKAPKRLDVFGLSVRAVSHNATPHHHRHYRLGRSRAKDVPVARLTQEPTATLSSGHPALVCFVASDPGLLSGAVG